ncbi:MAG: (d)CMP kinase [Gammaproteobacteria bacterium]|nr:(d)CMP kinase [Gammaproteobacteria bacterium]MYD81683.1 (d)CMP kinase [Gammaproteobacteria bacterium]
MTSKVPVITIDGLSASGKGTVANRVSRELEWNLLDSGLLYRVVAYLASEHNLEYWQEEAIAKLVEQRIRIEYSKTGIQASSLKESRELRDSIVYVLSDSLQHKTVQWNGKDVTSIVRGNEISRGAALVAASRRIRSVLVPKQREQRVEPGLVADGRDMGTVIFPDAQLKIFLEASLETRTKRRMAQLGAANTDESFHRVLQSLKDRDERDSLRDVAPAVPAHDAIQLDSSRLSVQETVDFVMRKARNRGIID